MPISTRTTAIGHRDALWPASFQTQPRARGAASGLAVLVVVCVVAVATDRHYWSDSQSGRTPTWLFLYLMVVPILLMGAALACALVARVPRAVYYGATTLAWLAAVLAVPLELLLLYVSGADMCETPPPPIQVYQNPWVSV